MLDLLLKLIDRLITLGIRREVVDRNTFTDIVKPAMDYFEKLHADYIESFEKYAALLTDESKPMNSSHPLFAAIRQDSLGSEHLRTAITEFWKLEDDPIVGEFIRAIKAYLTTLVPSILQSRNPSSSESTAMETLLEERPAINSVHLQGLVLSATSLGNISNAPVRIAYGMDADLLDYMVRDAFFPENHARQVALENTFRVISELQRRYRTVSTEYSHLRARLLAPK